MPSLPQAAFATCKIRSQHHHQYSEQNTTTAWKYRNNDNKNTKQNKFQNFPNEKRMYLNTCIIFSFNIFFFHFLNI